MLGWHMQFDCWRRKHRGEEPFHSSCVVALVKVVSFLTKKSAVYKPHSLHYFFFLWTHLLQCTKCNTCTRCVPVPRDLLPHQGGSRRQSGRDRHGRWHKQFTFLCMPQQQKMSLFHLSKPIPYSCSIFLVVDHACDSSYWLISLAYFSLLLGALRSS